MNQSYTKDSLTLINPNPAGISSSILIYNVYINALLYDVLLIQKPIIKFIYEPQ